jgi:WS/DGAT/MGAT family acyltransferase
MAGDRLTPLDASFLQLEDRRSHLHVAAVLVFDGDAPPYQEFLDFVAARLHLVPRYRQKVAADPLDLGRPHWIDDPGFDLRYHVRATALPRPAGEYELQVLAGRVFSQQLNRDKPLWEMWLVEGLEGGRHAVLSKTHHAVVDGISGLDILSVLFAPDEEGAEDDQWEPSPPPSDLELLADAVAERVTAPLKALTPVVDLALRPGRALERAREAAGGVLAMARAGLDPAPNLPYNRRAVGADRRYTWVRARLDDLKAIKNALGGTVNDAVLTVVTRALRRDLARRGVEVSGLEVKAFVPISVRPDEARGGSDLGNQVAGMLVRLPVSCADPAECFHRIRQSTAREKASGQAVGAQALTDLAGFAPPNLLIQGARLAARQRFVNLVVTNVPGPQYTLDSDGRRLRDIFPVVPVAKNLGLGIAIASYDGGIAFGLTADFDVVPDVERLAEDVEAGLEELADAAGVRRGGVRPEPVPA